MPTTSKRRHALNVLVSAKALNHSIMVVVFEIDCLSRAISIRDTNVHSRKFAPSMFLFRCREQCTLALLQYFVQGALAGEGISYPVWRRTHCSNNTISPVGYWMGFYSSKGV